MAAWPATLPGFLSDGYSVEISDATIRTDMESGPARVRRRYTAAPDNLSCSWKFSDAQMVAFREFFENDIMHGALWFDVGVMNGTTTAIVIKEARFSAPWKASRIPAFGWHVSAILELRNA